MILPFTADWLSNSSAFRARSRGIRSNMRGLILKKNIKKSLNTLQKK